MLVSHVQLFVTPWTVAYPAPLSIPGKDPGVGCCALLQGIFPTQGSKPGLLHCRQIFYCLGTGEAWEGYGEPVISYTHISDFGGCP